MKGLASEWTHWECALKEREDQMEDSRACTLVARLFSPIFRPRLLQLLLVRGSGRTVHLPIRSQQSPMCPLQVAIASLLFGRPSFVGTFQRTHVSPEAWLEGANGAPKQGKLNPSWCPESDGARPARALEPTNRVWRPTVDLVLMVFGNGVGRHV